MYRLFVLHFLLCVFFLARPTDRLVHINIHFLRKDTTGQAITRVSGSSSIVYPCNRFKMTSLYLWMLLIWCWNVLALTFKCAKANSSATPALTKLNPSLDRLYPFPRGFHSASLVTACYFQLLG